MRRLIDADALFRPDENSDKVLIIGGQRCGGKTVALAMELLKRKVAEAPTIDPAPQWIPVTERLPEKEEYLAKAKDVTEYMVRLLIAYQTDIVQYEIGYFDGHKWLSEMPMRRITDVLAWKPFFLLPDPPGTDLT